MFKACTAALFNFLSTESKCCLLQRPDVGVYLFESQNVHCPLAQQVRDVNANLHALLRKLVVSMRRAVLRVATLLPALVHVHRHRHLIIDVQQHAQFAANQARFATASIERGTCITSLSDKLIALSIGKRFDAKIKVVLNGYNGVFKLVGIHEHLSSSIVTGKRLRKKKIQQFSKAPRLHWRR